MKPNAIAPTSARKRPFASAVTSIGLALTVMVGPLSFSPPAFGEGGGTPIGDQGIEARRENEIQQKGGNDPNVWRGEVQRNERSQPSENQYRGNNQNRGNNQYRGGYQNRNEYRGHATRRYDDRNARNRRYEPPQRYGYANPYAYADPWLYAPPPLAYEPAPSPGLSLFFSF